MICQESGRYSKLICFSKWLVSCFVSCSTCLFVCLFACLFVSMLSVYVYDIVGEPDCVSASSACSLKNKCLPKKAKRTIFKETLLLSHRFFKTSSMKPTSIPPKKNPATKFALTDRHGSGEKSMTLFLPWLPGDRCKFAHGKDELRPGSAAKIGRPAKAKPHSTCQEAETQRKMT